MLMVCGCFLGLLDCADEKFMFVLTPNTVGEEFIWRFSFFKHRTLGVDIKPSTVSI